MVRACNDVAPIIIKDCKEEFQHVSDFKDPIVYGYIAENMPRHPLVKVKFDFLKIEVYFPFGTRLNGKTSI